MKKYIVCLAWNAIVHFIVFSVLLWGMLYFAVTGFNSIVPACILFGISLAFWYTFQIESTHKKNLLRNLSKERIDTICTIYLLGAYAASYYLLHLANATVIVSDALWDSMLQALPYGIGTAFTAMAYNSVGKVTEAVYTADAFSKGLPLSVITVAVTALASVMASIPNAFKIKEKDNEK